MRKQKLPSKIAAGPVRRAPVGEMTKGSGQRSQSGGNHIGLGQSYNGQVLPWRKQNNADPNSKI